MLTDNDKKDWILQSILNIRQFGTEAAMEIAGGILFYFTAHPDISAAELVDFMKSEHATEEIERILGLK